MTKSTITRERLQELAEGQSGFNLRIATHEESQELARIALAALDTEPVGEFYEDGPLNWYQISDGDRVPAHRRIPLYRHAQQAPASEQVYQYWCYTTVENSEGDPEEFWFWKDCEKDFYDLWKNAKRTLYKTPQPALVVPPEQHWEELCRQHPDMSIGDAIIRAAWWNHCRAAMLAAAQQSPGSEPATVQGKWIPVSEKMPPSRHEVLVGRWWGEKPRWCCKWATYIPGHPDSQSSGWLIPGGSWTPTHWMELPAAPQGVKP